MAAKGIHPFAWARRLLFGNKPPFHISWPRQMNFIHHEQKIRELLESRAQAIHSKDVNGVMRCFHPDADHFNLIPPLQADHTMASDLGTWFCSFSGPIGYEMKGIIIVCQDDLGFGHCLSRINGIKTDGARPDIWIRETFCFQNFGGMWKIVHIHDSVPFYRDKTFTAAMDLKP